MIRRFRERLERFQLRRIQDGQARPRRHVRRAETLRIETLVLEETRTYRPRLQIAAEPGTDLEAVDDAIFRAQAEAGDEGYVSFIAHLRDHLPEGARIQMMDLPESYRDKDPHRVLLHIHHGREEGSDEL
ncbi:hypothetical protein EXIGUO8A_440001 [Exiguobacterium sp. 8A]|uniref:hypothetical protein n=1 Tax=Exiguobacterium sp. 8A TaxID=2653139 RepID=UPI0012F1607A|nr:hypothetical protein [Exiguobacterium sp. 8A]VXB98046.1 hypothetical protein EXIGUO8A_440001 [Exiguobacterium sp. 8A]